VITVLALPGLAAPSPAGPGSTLFAYIGTYTGEKSKGIYVARFNPRSGAFTGLTLAAELPNPSFLAVHPKLPVLYAISEIDSFEGQRAGSVSAFQIDPVSGKLTLLNRAACGGSGPCHLSLDAEGRMLLVANYGGGSVAALTLASDGRLGRLGSVIQHSGSSINKDRQGGPHAHQIVPDPSGRFALACDLGLDQVKVYRCDSSSATLQPNDPPFGVVIPGAGPRHLAFRPDGRVAYVVNELNSSVTVMSFDADRGTLAQIQTVPTLAPDFKGENYCAEVQVHPSGRFLYASNRGDDSIAVYRIDPATGKLGYVANEPTGGKTPRYIGLDPSGRWVVSANQGSDSITVFQVEGESGRLFRKQEELKVATPVCMLFVPAGGNPR